jgi:hypothetical protein
VTCDERRKRLETTTSAKATPLAGGGFVSKMVATYRSSRLTPKFSSALATADLSSFENGQGSAIGHKAQHFQSGIGILAANQVNHRRTFGPK